jgi:ATP-dependent protease HslVU (ClpYQ) peptidase subunit
VARPLRQEGRQAHGWEEEENLSTVAANRRMIAADSMNCDHTELVDTCQKLHRTSIGIVGFAGSEQSTMLFLEWVEGGCPRDDKPDVGEEIEALVLSERGLSVYYGKLVEVPVHGEFWAAGSGGNIAMGAMAAGKGPKEAVEIACVLNAATGPPVVVERL